MAACYDHDGDAGPRRQRQQRFEVAAAGQVADVKNHAIAGGNSPLLSQRVLLSGEWRPESLEVYTRDHSRRARAEGLDSADLCIRAHEDQVGPQHS